MLVNPLKAVSATSLVCCMAVTGAGLATSACSSSQESSADMTIEEARQQEYGALSDSVIQNFHEQLTSLALAMQERNDLEESALRARLTTNALRYKSAIEAGINDDDSVRRRAISAAMAGFSGDAKHAMTLARMAADETLPPAVSQYATVGLVALGARINESPQRADVIRYLDRLRLPSAFDWKIRINAVTAYAAAYSPAHGDNLATLTEVVIQDPEESVRRQALLELRRIGDPGALPEITRIALNDPSATVRAAAADALGGISDIRSLDAIKQSMDDKDAMVRAHAVHSLSTQYAVEPDLVRDLIVEGLADFDERVRAAAAIAAGEVRDPGITRPLVQSIGDRSDNVRLAVVTALGTVIQPGNEKEAFALAAALDDGDHEIAMAAHRSLKQVTHENLEADPAVWRKWFYAKYPMLDPDNAYKDQLRPRYVTTGVRTGPRAPRTTQPSYPSRPQQQPPSQPSRPSRTPRR